LALLFILIELNIWNNNIKDAIKHNKIAHKEWKEARKPKCPQNLLVLRKIETRKIYRLEIRKEESKRVVIVSLALLFILIVVTWVISRLC
jgi:hypothetical protein